MAVAEAMSAAAATRAALVNVVANIRVSFGENKLRYYGSLKDHSIGRVRENTLTTAG
jgi:hypothetical protein